LIAPKYPLNESKRLNAVKSYNLLDTIPESDYDNITALVAHLLQLPISLVTLLDTNRNFLKSHHGVPFNESPREISFCGHAILEESPIFIIEDARKDERFTDNPLVTEHNAIFYAGVPLKNPDGYSLGTLCAFGHEPKELNQFEKETLIALGKQVVHLFELRKKNRELLEAKTSLKIKNENLKNFAANVSHDLKMPLANIIVSSDIVKQKFINKENAKGKEYLNYIKNSSLKLSDYISSLLEHYETDTLNEGELFSANQLIEEVIDLLNIDSKCEIHLPEEDVSIHSNRVALEQIFLNLIGNSLKYNDKPITKIKIGSFSNETHVFFELTDNGIGIEKEKLNDIFNLFSTTGSLDKFGNSGHGIGLSTVKNLVEKLDGEITVNSVEGESTTFLFSVAIDE